MIQQGFIQSGATGIALVLGTAVPLVTALYCSPGAEQDVEGGCQAVILMGRLVVVHQGQLIHGGDEEIVVDAQMAVVMNEDPNVAGE